MMTQQISKSDENEVLVTESFDRSGESDARKVIENESENEQESYFYLPPALTTPVAQEHVELQPSKYQISNLISASKVSAFQKFVKQTICEEDEEDYYDDDDDDDAEYIPDNDQEIHDVTNVQKISPEEEMQKPLETNSY